MEGGLSATCGECALHCDTGHFLWDRRILKPLSFSCSGSMQPPGSDRERGLRARGRLQVGEGVGRRPGRRGNGINGSLSSSPCCLQQTEVSDQHPLNLGGEGTLINRGGKMGGECGGM